MVSRNTTLTVTLTGDASQLRRVLGGAERDLSTLDRTSAKTASGVSGSFATLQAGYLGITAAVTGVVAATAAAQAVIAKSIDAASNLAEQQNKVNVVFGSSANAVNQFAQTAATSLAMSSREALQATGTFGNLFTAMGQSQQSAAGMSIEMTKLAADLSSFNNVPIAEALAALQSGIVGEIEPMRRFGVAINAAAVESKALEMGLASTKAEITEADKVMARYKLILEGTKTAQGDMSRTMDSFANQQRAFAARWEETTAAIGSKFLPAATGALSAINKLLSPTGEAALAVQRLDRAFTEFGQTTLHVPEKTDLVRFGLGKLTEEILMQHLPAVRGLRDAFGELAESQRQFLRERNQKMAQAGALVEVDAARGPSNASAVRPVNPAEGGMGSVSASQSLVDAIAKIKPEEAAKTSEEAQKVRNEFERLAFVGREASDAIKGTGGAAAALKDAMEPGLITEARNLQMAHKMMEEAELAAAGAAREFEESTKRAAQSQQFYADYLRGLSQQGTRFAPGVFEGLARAGGMTPLADLIAGGATITQTNVATGASSQVDVVVP